MVKGATGKIPVIPCYCTLTIASEHEWQRGVNNCDDLGEGAAEYPGAIGTRILSCHLRICGPEWQMAHGGMYRIALTKHTCSWESMKESV